MAYLKTTQANALHRAMLEAREALAEIHEQYDRTLAIAMAADAAADNAFALKHEGLAYAQALTHCSEATMTWLVFADTHLRSKKKSLSVGHSTGLSLPRFS